MLDRLSGTSVPADPQDAQLGSILRNLRWTLNSRAGEAPAQSWLGLPRTLDGSGAAGERLCQTVAEVIHRAEPRLAQLRVAVVEGASDGRLRLDITASIDGGGSGPLSMSAEVDARGRIGLEER
jgi:type VI secretion system lysozyme-like protein